TLDAKSVRNDWLTNAYGEKAGAAMQKFYNHLDNWFRAYYQENKTAGNQLTLGMLKYIYGGHYPEIEKLFLKAKSMPMKERQQKRLQLIEDNLIVLQWRLRNADLWPKDYSSKLQQNDKEVINLLI